MCWLLATRGPTSPIHVGVDIGVSMGCAAQMGPCKICSCKSYPNPLPASHHGVRLKEKGGLILGKITPHPNLSVRCGKRLWQDEECTKRNQFMGGWPAWVMGKGRGFGWQVLSSCPFPRRRPTTAMGSLGGASWMVPRARGTYSPYLKAAIHPNIWVVGAMERGCVG